MPRSYERRDSPFFKPSTPQVQVAETPGGTKRTVKQEIVENKSNITGATANLINAIVGSGIVGIPYAIQQSGLVAGIVLIITCAILTEKSLRLLVETAKHASAPSYETVMEAAFGRFGFLFVSINMFVMAYGAMVSYLMIVKDTIPYVLGITDLGARRAVLFLVSLTIMVPLSSQRDMANLAKTSQISVILDFCMVAIVAICAPIRSTLQDVGGLVTVLQKSTLHLDTVFIGLGVLSFAFVCQHSAFIIAGSLERPTRIRWATVTLRALIFCGILANLCGITGYLGFLEHTQGNILNNLDPHGVLPNIARGMLGTTMLFVFPMESFVARHVCVVTLFEGRRAHEGEDAAILNRRDRRISLTMALYIIALVPALLFENLGNVLSVTGAIGGSCLSYIGPGAVYIGIHGSELVQMAHDFWKFGSMRPQNNTEVRPLTAIEGNAEPPKWEHDSSTVRFFKGVLWYLFGMPLWYSLGKVGASGFDAYKRELATKSPHLSRIGKYKRRPIRSSSATMLRQGSFPTASYQQGTGPVIFLPPPTPTTVALKPVVTQQPDEEEDEDPQLTPDVVDFIIAVGFILFGIVALTAGLLSIFATQA